MQVIIEESEYKALKKKESATVDRLSKKCELLQKQVDELKKIKFKRLNIKSYNIYAINPFLFGSIDEIYNLEKELDNIKSSLNIDFGSDEELKKYLDEKLFSEHKKLKENIKRLEGIYLTPWYRKLIGRFDNGQSKKSP